MDYETYDKHANPDDEDEDAYFNFVMWLRDRTASELQEAKGDPQAQRLVLLRYWKRGYRANLSPGELIDFLGVDSPCILEMTGYSDEESNAAMQLSDSLTLEDIDQAVLYPGQSPLDY